MKKRWFTLIELLAVIVVLAITALIATPIVMNTIKNVKKGAAERSADNYIKTVELAISTSEINSNLIPDGEYSIGNDSNLIGTNLPYGKLEIEMNRNKPTSGIIVIEDGQVTIDYNDYKARIILAFFVIKFDKNIFCGRIYIT